jgi:hypothetical protein
VALSNTALGSTPPQETNEKVFKMHIYTRENLSDIYPQSQLRNFIEVIISLCITTCFGPYRPSSGEYNYYFKNIFEKAIVIPTDPL